MTLIVYFYIWIFPVIMNGYKEISLMEFNSGEDIPEWIVINDVVMGGVSTSDIEFLPAGYMRFTGNISMENNGGFASFRSQSAMFDLSEYDGLKIRVKGDGKKYSFRLRTNNTIDGVAYAADFQTQNKQWQEITIPFKDFTPRFRGRIIMNAEELNKSRVTQIGFLISDRQQGAFSLEIDWIKAFSDSN